MDVKSQCFKKSILSCKIARDSVHMLHTVGSFSLEDDAQHFFHYCFIKNNEVDQVKHALCQKYGLMDASHPIAAERAGE
jgi:hypothetical protein